MYHLPLLPGYTSSNIRSSAPAKSKTGKSVLSHLSEAEEEGYQGSYFQVPPPQRDDGYITSSPVEMRHPFESDVSTPGPTYPQSGEETATETETEARQALPRTALQEEVVAEAVFFDYGVIVFFGFDEGQERSIIDDIENAGIMSRKLVEDDWEIEECHFTVGLFICNFCRCLRMHSMTLILHTLESTTTFSVA